MLTPNTTYKLNGVTVNEKIIPDGTRWKDATKAEAAGFEPNELYKQQEKLSGGTGEAQYVTIHNTRDLGKTYDDGEQYTRATYYENMGAARVHLYVDDTGAWQNLRAGTGLCPADPNGSAEVGFHAGDGLAPEGGNVTSIGMEIIMGEGSAHDEKAKDNGARIAAWLLRKHGLSIDKLVTHTYWVNKSAGKHFSDVDEQCTNPIPRKKWCPAYIFASTNRVTAKKNWLAFKALVQKYLDALNGTSQPTTKPAGEILYRVQTGAFAVKANADKLATELKAKGFDTYIVKVGNLYKVQVGAYAVKANADAMSAQLKKAGYNNFITTTGANVGTGTVASAVAFSEGDKVKCNAGVKTFANGVRMAPWVPSALLYVRKVENGGKILRVSTEPVKKVYTGRVNAADVHKV